MKRKAVFFDIDGTLYIHGKPLIPSAVAAIAKLRENGHLAFVCSGRSRVMIPQTPVMDMGFDGVVGACGAYGEYQGGELFRISLDENRLDEMIRVFRKYKIGYILEGTEYIYYDEETYEEKEEDWYLRHVRETIPDKLLSVQSVDAIDACKASIHVRNIEPKELYDMFRKDYDILEHVFGIAEFVPKGCTKAEGIRRICECFDIDREDTIAVGDSINDVDMLRYAGIGVCMGNGTEPAKAIADYITDDIFEDGLYNAMEHLGLF